MDDLKTFRLISFKLCPFVQRSVITLSKKGIPFEIDYIDLENKPEWFLKISPFGKVPVLQIENDVLFESAVINEYLDEVTPPRISPTDPLDKAKNKAWIEFGSNLIMLQYKWSMSKFDEHYDEFLHKIQAEIAKVEPMIKGNYFNGPDFALIDAAFAPFFTRLQLLDPEDTIGISDLSNVSRWAQNLVYDRDVKRSVVDNFDDLFMSYIEQKNPFFFDKISQQTTV
jgi:glutathione S-transferase